MTKCYVHLGKHGDLIILLPGWLRVAQATGKRPVVMVSREFAKTLEGVSYVEPWVVDLHWYGDCGKARIMAEEKYGKENVTFPKWWDDPTFTPPAIRNDATSLIIHGKRMQIESGEWFSYMASQWKYAGFPFSAIGEKPVFDCRAPERESFEFKYLTRTNKPKLLVCLNTGGSSPFGYVPEVQKVIYRYREKFEIIDLMNMRLEYIYDLLGFMDRSVGLVTTDTAILHLAGACNISYFAYVANGGGGSICRGNCAVASRYACAEQSLPYLEKYLDAIYEQSSRLYPNQAVPQPAAPLPVP